MTTYRVFLGLGSNIGERQKHLNRAAAELKTAGHEGGVDFIGVRN